MSRKILCSVCGVIKPMHPEDVVNGFHRRRTILQKLNQPVMCDLCGNVIEPGKMKHGEEPIAETIWRGDDLTPAEWEQYYEG